MQVQVNNSCYKTKFYSPKFEGITNFNFSYILKDRSHLVPERMLRAMKDLLQCKTAQEPTLRELHLRTYAPLLECKTLDEARVLFDEFRGVLDAAIFENSSSKNIKELKKHIDLSELSLRLLQDTWGRLKTQDEIAQELGLKGRQQLEWFKDKINFVNKDKNYTQLLKRSDPILHQEMSAKTTAFNQKHQERMFEHNKKAAQGCKTPEYRAKRSEISKEMYIKNPDLREEAKRRTQRAWEKLPERTQQMSELSVRNSVFINDYVNKYYKNASPAELERIKEKVFYQQFWSQGGDAARKDLSKAMSEAGKEINEEIAKEKGTI